jgi:hypothetical protein
MPPGGTAAPPQVVNTMKRLPSVADQKNIWLSQRHHVAQALRLVLQAGKDTLTMVPFASLAVNGATRAIKTFEVRYSLFAHSHQLGLIRLPPDCLGERSSRNRRRSAAQGGALCPTTALSEYPRALGLYARRSPSQRDSGVRLVRLLSSLFLDPEN